VNTALPRSPSRILVIDDDDHFRETVQWLLRKQGFQVFVAEDGKKGVWLAAQESPDLVLCDLVMPEMDGYEVLVTLRQDPRLADIPLIFLTGQSEPGQVRQGMNLGADDYLAKGGDPLELLSAINVRLARRQLEKARAATQMERALQLFAGIVHDLRDPLSVVFGYTDLLKSGAVGPPDSQAKPKEILERMQQAMIRMQAILSETLFLARSRMQRLPFDPGPFDLRYFCRQLIAEHEQSARLQFECAAKLCPVVADALRLRQALDQLLSNALKYSTGSVLIRLAALPGRYQIEVQDKGIGIPPKEQASIFEPFFRASNTQSTPGNGLGLSIVRSCVEQHGASIHFTSQLNEGTTFFIDLPATPLPALETTRPESARPGPPAGEPVPTSGASGVGQSLEPWAAVQAHSSDANDIAGTGLVRNAPPLRALLVDDDSLVRGVLRDLLEGSGQVSVLGEAESLSQARQLLGSATPDVVFLDVNLPDGSGFDLLPRLGAGISVVFVTSAEEHAVHAFDCEAVDYLLKPVTTERLQKTLWRLRQRLGGKSPTLPPTPPNLNDSFLVKTLTEQRLIKVAQVKQILAYGEYSWVYWENEKKGALLRKSLKQWLRELPSDRFIRVHRRAIVNLRYLERIEKLPGARMQIHMRGAPEPIPVSLRLGPRLNRMLKAGQT
jgi:signal transduction histidine kinase